MQAYLFFHTAKPDLIATLHEIDQIHFATLTSGAFAAFAVTDLGETPELRRLVTEQLAPRGAGALETAIAAGLAGPDSWPIKNVPPEPHQAFAQVQVIPSGPDVAAVRDAVASHPRVVRVTPVTIDRFQLLAEVGAASRDELRRALDQELPALPGVARIAVATAVLDETGRYPKGDQWFWRPTG